MPDNLSFRYLMVLSLILKLFLSVSITFGLKPEMVKLVCAYFVMQLNDTVSFENHISRTSKKVGSIY